MTVTTYPDGGTATLGSARWEVEWWTPRPGAEMHPDGIGPDNVDSNYRAFRTENAAMRHAAKMAPASALGCAMVQKQVCEPFVDGLGEWVAAGESVEVTG